MALIELQDICKTYQMGNSAIHALNGLNCEIEKGEYVALMGTSGSGNSTLMNVIGCLDSPTSGTYSLNNIDVSSMTDDELATIRNVEIGFVFQSFNLLPRTSAIENVALPLVYAGVSKKERLERAQVVLEQVGLGDRGGHKPNELSGGQRQRVAIARALINNPSIVLADEPTGNHEPQSRVEVMQVLQEMNSNGNTIVMATHDYALLLKYPSKTIKCDAGQLFEVVQKTV